MRDLLLTRLSPFRHRDFRNFFIAQTLSMIGSWSHDLARSWIIVEATASSGALGNLNVAIEHADPEAREVLERAAVADLEVDAAVEARNLIAAAVRRELRQSPSTGDPTSVRDDAEARVRLEELASPIPAAPAAEWLLGWLHRRMEQRHRGGS